MTIKLNLEKSMNEKDISERIFYLQDSLSKIKGGSTDYALSCSEFTTWCSILKVNCTEVPEGRNLVRQVEKLEQELKDYQIYLANSSSILSRFKQDYFS